MITAADDDGRRILVVEGLLPALRVLEVAAEQRMPIHVGQLPSGVVDLDFLEPIVRRVRDLRVFAPGVGSVEAIQRMSALEHLLVDDQLDLPAVDLGGHRALRTCFGRLDLVPGVLELPTLHEAGITVRPGQRLDARGPALRTLHVAHEPRARSLAPLTIGAGLTTLGLSRVHDLTLADVPPLPELEHLDLLRVGTLRDVDLLRRFPALRTLTLTDVRQVDVDALGRLDVRIETLRTLPVAERGALRALRHVTVLD